MTKSDLEKKVTYTSEEAKSSAKEYFKGQELQANVWVNKYALKDSAGNIYEKSPEDMHRRLAKEIGRIESKYNNSISEEKVYELIKDFKYIVPQGGPMTGIGNDYQIASLSNCFVIGDENTQSDSYGGILKIDQEQIQLMKRRGGVGHDLSHIRPAGSPVKNSALTSTGIVPFMERYSNSTREVAQDGRRGALMLSVSVKHPDSEAFIDAKLTPGKITGANVSVKLDDEFMNAAIKGDKYIQQYPIDSDNPQVKKEIDAGGLWKKIVHNAWKSAEPGIMFWDTIIKESVPDSYADQGYRTVSTNPCGEIPLCPYDSCRLLAINLNSYVEKPYTDEAKFNFDLFKEHVHYAQRMMDDIIDLEAEKIDSILDKVEKDPEGDEVKRTEKLLWEKIKHKNLEGRRTGIGITAEGDMLAAMGLRYGTDEAIDFSEEVHKTLAIEAYRSSVNLAKDRGAFKIYDAEKEKDNPFINRLKEADSELYEEMTKHGRRNIALLTIAPTGTTSLMTQTTSGIEPSFMPFHFRNRKVNPNDKDVIIHHTDENGDAWENYPVFEAGFQRYLEATGHNVEEVIKLGKESVKDPEKEKEFNKIIEASPYYKATSNDVDWVSKVKMQGRIQKWVDHSISVTVNLPEDVKEEVVGDVYEAAWKAGCKGVTVYRDGSRGEGVLNSGKTKKNSLESKALFPEHRPESVDAEVMRFNNMDENNNVERWIAFIGKIDGRPYELFTGKEQGNVLSVPSSVKKGRIVKKSNGQTHYDFHFIADHGFESVVGGISHQFDSAYWNLSRMISGMMRNGVPLEDIRKVVSKLDDGEEGINTWKAGVNRVLGKQIEDGTISKELCKSCLDKGEEVKLVFSEGCEKCPACSESKCG